MVIKNSGIERIPFLKIKQIGIGYQVGKIYRKYCWDIISIMMAIMSTAIVIYFGEWIKIYPAKAIRMFILYFISWLSAGKCNQLFICTIVIAYTSYKEMVAFPL